jgi:Kef-type K+ transport system membrane component KefB
MSAFSEIAIILLVTFGVSIIMRILKQPLIIGYIFSGIIAGPYVLNIIHSQEIMELLSKIGITALLFIVGLGLSPKVLKETGVAAGATGFGQIFFTTLITYFSATALGFNSLESFYIGISFLPPCAHCTPCPDRKSPDASAGGPDVSKGREMDVLRCSCFHAIAVTAMR